jgi:hypothetical protein
LTFFVVQWNIFELIDVLLVYPDRVIGQQGKENEEDRQRDQRENAYSGN